jgi:hypothetical protein
MARDEIVRQIVSGRGQLVGAVLNLHKASRLAKPICGVSWLPLLWTIGLNIKLA